MHVVYVDMGVNKKLVIYKSVFTCSLTMLSAICRFQIDFQIDFRHTIDFVLYIIKKIIFTLKSPRQRHFQMHLMSKSLKFVARNITN